MAQQQAQRSAEARSMALEQYKVLVADLGNIGSRYATSNAFYMAVIAALVTLVAYKMDPTLVVLVGIFAAYVCLIWSRTIRSYRYMFYARFEVLRLLETKLPVRAYFLENEILQGRLRKLLPVEEAGDGVKNKISMRLAEGDSWVPLWLLIFFVLVVGVTLLTKLTPGIAGV